MNIKERFIATLHGCAYGDTLGMAVEGWKREQIQRYAPGGKVTEQLAPIIVCNPDGSERTEDEFGKLKYWTRGLQKGEWTDDTIFTAAIAESIVASSGLNLNSVAQQHLALYRQLPAAAYGTTTRDALENLAHGISPLQSGVIGGPGNGPAMKMSPLGLYMHATGKYDEGIAFAEQISAMTHLDPRSIVSGVLQAHAVFVLLNDVSRQFFISSLIALSKKREQPLTEQYVWHKKGSLTSRLSWIHDNQHVDDETAFATLGASSAVYQSYPFALWMFQKHGFGTPEQTVNGLLTTINYGGDCDTTGAIYGALCGSRHGLIFPEPWTRATYGLDKLASLAEEIYALRPEK